MKQRDGRQQVVEAKQIASDYGLLLVEKTYAKQTGYLLYRKTAARLVFLGRRSTPKGIRSLVTKCAGFR